MVDRQLPLTSGIGWIGIVARRPQTLAFYGDVMGLRLEEQDPAYDYLKAGEGTFVELYAPDSRGGCRIRDDAPAVGFLVDDLDAAAERLRAAGADVSETVSEWSSPDETHRWFYVRDPEENVIVLIERTVYATRPRLGHVNLAVGDLERALGFYVHMLGFKLVQQGDGTAFLSISDDHHQLGLTVTSDLPGPTESEILAHAAFRYPSRASAERCSSDYARPDTSLNPRTTMA